MTDNIIRKFAVEDVPAKRLAYIEKVVLPPVKKAFEDAPQLNSASLLVSQYWCDEAIDAVYGNIVYALSLNPDLIAFREDVLRRAQNEDSYSPNKDWAEIEKEESALMTFIEGPKIAGILGDRFEDFVDDYRGDAYRLWRNWHHNTEAIPLFAAYCMEGGHQEGIDLEFSSPCAILRRGDGDEVTIEVLDKMARPWMEGVSPERETRETDLKDINKIKP